MKATKDDTSGTFSIAPARGKFGKICLVLLLLATAVFCGFAPRAWADPAGCWTDEGNYDISWYTDNKEAEEYDLWDAADLAGLAYLVNNNMEFFYSSNASGGKIVRLRAPVDMSAHYWEPIGVYRRGKVNNAWETKAGFVGTFDGGNHEISGIVVKRDEANPEKSVYAGFFGYINFNRNDLGLTITSNVYPRILSVNLVKAYIEGALEPLKLEGMTTPIEPLAAGIVANGHGTSGTTIRDCTFSGYVEGYDAAGIVGQNNSGTTTSCVNKGGVSAVRYAGGIAARIVYGGNVVLSTNEGPVASKFAAGGIAGAHGTARTYGPGYIQYCSSTGPVYGEPYSGAMAGYIKDRPRGNDYSTCWYWLNGTGADVFPSGQVGNAKSSLGGSELTLNEGTLVEAHKAETLAEMPPTTVIFDYSDAPFGRMEGYKTDNTRTPGRYIYPNDEGVYSIGPVAVYPTGIAGAENLIISSKNTSVISRKNLTKEEYSKAYAACMTSDPGNPAQEMVVFAEDNSMYGEYANGLLRRGTYLPMLYIGKIVPLPSVALSDATLKAGETTVLTASFDPDTTPQSARGLKWSSDDESVATVDASGKVTAVGVGQARITATPEVFEEASPAECVVTVNKNDVQIEGVALNETAVEVKPGDKLQLSASVLPEGSPQGVTWSSSNAEVASVDEAGLVTAIAEGTAVVTATSSADSSKSASCTVTVTASAPLPVVVTADCVIQDPGSLEASTEQLPEGVEGVVTSVSPESETNALETLAAGGHTGTPNIEGIDRTEPGAVNALTTFSLDVQHDDGADGDLTMTINLSASINVAEGSSLYAFIPYRDDPQKFGSFACTPANGAKITSVTFTVTGYARFFTDAPVILASVKDSAPQPAPSGGGGGGCSAGFGALALLAAVPLLARRKK